MMPSSQPSGPAEAVIDLSAITANVQVCAERAPGAEVMAVVKADGYGHGLTPTAQAARLGGAGWLGVAHLSEGLALRAAGDHGPILSWLLVPGDDLETAVRSQIDLSASYPGGLDLIAAAAQAAGRTARVHLKVDTGLSRGGATAWEDLVRHARRLSADGSIEVIGVWSHLAWADDPQHLTTTLQIARFREAVALAERIGVRPQLRHLANSAATLTTPSAHFDLVRPGLAVYGLNPVPHLPAVAAALRPAMTLRARLALVKQIPAGAGVSYGHAYHATHDTTVALVPVGYADGIPRAASNCGPVQLAGRRHRVAGRVCMDQFVIDLDGRPDVDQIAAGDLIEIFGDGRHGGPTAQDWAAATDTISYEVITRIGARVPRRYCSDPAGR